jgi:hypothetical protein
MGILLFLRYDSTKPLPVESGRGEVNDENSPDQC